MEANLNNFSKDKSQKDFLSTRCIECFKKHNKEKYLLNKEKYKNNIELKIINNQFINSKFNDYIIDGDTTKIIMTNKNKEEVFTIIDTEDLEYIKSYGLRWHIRNDKNTKTQYAISTRWEMKNGELKHIIYALHLLILNTKKGEYVDHINHDTLNNKKENLRVTTNSNNTRNRKSKNSNNKSGYRNVCWLKDVGQWCVQLQLDGKNTRLGFLMMWMKLVDMLKK